MRFHGHRLASRTTKGLILIISAVLLVGCGTGASFNDSLPLIEPAAGPDVTSSTPLTSGLGQQCRMEHLDPGTHLVGLTLSGGGARAAVFSAATIFELADLGLMDEVDVISGASGGALTAAYYAVTCDDAAQDECTTSLGRKRRLWNRDEVLYDRLSRDFLLRSLLWRFEPYHLARTMFTAYDNTDIFAKVLSDNIYDEPGLGRDFKFADINPGRPFLVINATNATGTSVTSLGQSRVFTFTRWQFDDFQSDLCSFKVGRAVAASSAYPGVFNYTTLSRYRLKADEQEYEDHGYVHLFDAGASDNLAIDGFLEAMEELSTEGTRMEAPDRHAAEKAAVFVVDAQNGFDLRSQELRDPRSRLDRLIDRNFIDVYDTLMERNYGFTIRRLDEELEKKGFAEAGTRNIFHVALKALNPGWSGYERAGAFHAEAQEDTVTFEERGKLLDAVNNIKTSYGLNEREVHCLAASAHVLVSDLRPRLGDLFGKLREVSEKDRERFREDADACLSEEKRETKPLLR